MTGEVTLLGVRHHGPGSARAVASALTALRPDAVLIEGPPEADAVLALAGRPETVPPVALLVHPVDDPARAACWPFAAFSPEWVALRHALAAGVAVRFIDLPAAARFAVAEEPSAAAEPDPIALLAAAAGHPDPESWWEDVVEHRLPGRDPLEPFAAIAEAMGELRSGDPVGTPGSPGAAPGLGELREAHMRLQIRAARRAGHRRIAVVCGAWHVPALAAPRAAGADRLLLATLPKRPRTETTWVPWTHGRLALRSGYGAGIESPGWYQHLYDTAGDPAAPARWFARAADLLRAADRPVSAAQVIEAVRLAETLAALRGRPLPGLAEMLDAVRAVLCDGSEVALALVREQLVVGEALGQVPADAPAVPLQRDLARLQRTLRLKPEPQERELVLDLRKELDAGRSLLLHRLRLLELDWGRPVARGGTGTFKEVWRLRWEPGFAVRAVTAAQWGTTVEGAAAGRLAGLAERAATPAELAGLAEQCLLTELPAALPAVLAALADRAALGRDTAALADALPALVRALRYGDVRGTDRGALAQVARGLAERVRIGLGAACTGLGAEGAAAMRDRLDAVHRAVGLLAAGSDGPSAALADRWAEALAGLVDRAPAGGSAGAVPGLLRGRAARLLLDDGRLDVDRARRQLGLALSRAGEPADAAGWIEGFLAGGGALLLHDPHLLGLLDDWLTAVPEAEFGVLLPVLRRGFAALEPGVRRGIGARVAAGGPVRGPAADAEPPLDQHRADAALPTVRRLLGLPGRGPEPAARPRIPRQSDRRHAA
ncbi:DUF5682 family protein [Kitasatospora sp. NPDC058965]|uniref:DUF5682 family protein n=1 Tax=Kitasatospora sp. NPDC058965 TaxID=3346682 RepID=UPI0036A6D10A